VATILLIDDSETHRAEIRAAIEASGIFDRVLQAADGLRGLKLLLAEPVDVVLCDLEMPGLDGDKLLLARSARPGAAEVPFVFLTASQDMGRRARLLEDGACDAIAKPFHPMDLIARLRLHLKVKRLQDELLVKNATLARLSTVDELTGLRSRRYVSEVLSIEFQRARRYGTALSLVMADLDHFKKVNDRYGHPGGDAVLQGVAQLLLRSLRATDVAGRFGGEELLVVLPQIHGEGAMIMAERWRASVEHTDFQASDGRPIHAELSIGVAEYTADLPNTDALIVAVDKALYTAKQNGRNRVELFRPSGARQP
jgi:two-component system cell cycle response regulator